MKIILTGDAVVSAHFKQLSKGVSLLIINTKERWHYFDASSSNRFNKEFSLYWWGADKHPAGELQLIAETEEEASAIDRLRYSLHEKEQIELMFIDEELL